MTQKKHFGNTDYTWILPKSNVSKFEDCQNCIQQMTMFEYANLSKNMTEICHD